MTTMRSLSSSEIHASLSHPVIDCDGHWFEPVPVLFDYIRDEGGADVFEELVSMRKNSAAHAGATWYSATAEQRNAKRLVRGGWWGQPTQALDRATAMIPALLAERMDEIGLDFAVIYPTVGLMGIALPREDLRRAYSRAYNRMCADMFGPHADRLTPVATIPSHTPGEAVEELEHAVLDLGLKTIVINNAVRRPIAAYANGGSDGTPSPYFLDNLALDSEYDYDPFWRRCVELGVAVTAHSGAYGLPDRMSTTNWQCNSLGHFAQINHMFARSLFMGGVTNRFPELNFAFLEGGVGWACNLYTDLISRWKKRSGHNVDHYDPLNCDLEEMRALLTRHGGRWMSGRVDELMQNLDSHNPGMSLEEVSTREVMRDEYAASGATSEADFERLFVRPFYFGCEGEDATIAWAFDPRRLAPLHAVFSSDISHWDVRVMSDVLAEAHELVTDGILSPADFRKYSFEYAVDLYGRMNPTFFDGTRVADAARELLAQR
jgi:predicted TIM-barrel fold metal-dependent hydrolase